ncbi:uncharacterized protein LOC107269968 [Cephus cinctus]|uniref:Uncharacterized protein LOC107269968 n=1 Tax=Cephus cinctus TaxID=211228 RepID=A0AAJ7C347_CEPCN|nr:uncharacterized protein LOC107269968 [Cephus cinctus]
MRGRTATAFVKMNAQVLALVSVEALLVALAAGASIGGFMGLDKDSLSTAGEIVFPKIPGINKPLLSNLSDIIEQLSGLKSAKNSTGNDSTDGQTNSTSKQGLPKLPSLSDLIPKIPAIKDPSSVLLPNIPRLPNISDVANSPELAAALEKARNATAAAIGHGSDLISGIHKAMDQAIRSLNPTQAMRSLVDTILKTYQAVAKSCPTIAIGIKVLTEGIRLSFEVGKSIKNIILT